MPSKYTIILFNIHSDIFLCKFLLLFECIWLTSLRFFSHLRLLCTLWILVPLIKVHLREFITLQLGIYINVRVDLLFLLIGKLIHEVLLWHVFLLRWLHLHLKELLNQGCLRNVSFQYAIINIIYKKLYFLPRHSTLPKELFILVNLFLLFLQQLFLLVDFQQLLVIFLLL